MKCYYIFPFKSEFQSISDVIVEIFDQMHVIYKFSAGHLEEKNVRIIIMMLLIKITLQNWRKKKIEKKDTA